MAMQVSSETETAARTAVDPSLATTIHEAFERCSRAHPNAPAVVLDGAIRSYAEVASLAAAIEDCVISLTQGPGDRAVILLDRSLQLPGAIIGVLSAACTCVMIDPTDPPKRVARLLAEAEPRLVVTVSDYIQLVDKNLPVLLIDELTPRQEVRTLAKRHTDASLAAFIFFTSGSTGVPKGVVVSHRAIVSIFPWVHDTLKTGVQDRHLMRAPVSFVGILRQMIWPLVTGGSVVMLPPRRQSDLPYLVELLLDAEITVAHFMPSALSTFLLLLGDRKAPCLRTVFCGAGKLTPRLLAGLFGVLSEHARLFNAYALTEMPNVCARECFRHEQFDTTVIPCGPALAGAQVHILDERLRPTPPGETGEIYVGGPGIATGYHRDPELTSQKFIENPFERTHAPVLFKTGDVGRLWGDGELQVLDRTGGMAKIRGYRIEPSEVELAIAKHPQVREVFVTTSGRDDSQRLVAYVAAGAALDLSGGELSRWLAPTLPAYMIPTDWFVVPTLPKTFNGKLDRGALDSLVQERPDQAVAYRAPINDMQKSLVTIWEGLLRVQPIGVDDDFFDLGGDSLLPARMISQANEDQIPLTLSLFYETRTIARIAAKLETPSRASGTPVAPKKSRVLKPTPGRTDIRGLDLFLAGIAYELGRPTPLAQLAELRNEPQLLEQLHSLGLSHYAAHERSVLELAQRALQRTVQMLPCAPEEVGILILATNSRGGTGSLASRVDASRLARDAGLVNAQPFAVGLAGCANLQWAFQLASALLASTDATTAIVLTADQFEDNQSRIVPPDISVVSDAAASAFVTKHSTPGFQLLDTVTSFDSSTGDLSPDHHKLEYMQSTAIGISRTISSVLETRNLAATDLRALIMNNYNAATNRSIAAIGQFTHGQTFLENIERFAHALAADNLINLADYAAKYGFERSEYALLLGTAPNAWGGTLVRGV